MNKKEWERLIRSADVIYVMLGRELIKVQKKEALRVVGLNPDAYRNCCNAQEVLIELR